MRNVVIQELTTPGQKRMLAIGAMILAITTQGPAAQAQTAPGRFYAGVGINFSNYIIKYNFGSPADYEAGRWQPTVGYYVTPRLALQVGYSRYKAFYSGVEGEGVMLNGDRIRRTAYTDASFFAIPVLARYTLNKNPVRGFCLDLIGGMTFGKGKYAGGSQEIVNDITTLESSEQYAFQHSYFTVGAGVRYAFSRHWELEAIYTLSRNTKRMPDFYNEMTLSPYGLTSGYGLNLRYRFGIGKPQPATE